MKICKSILASPYHIFKKLDNYFVFDTTSYRFYKIDEITYQFLKLCLEHSIEEVENILISEKRFSEEEILRVSKEVQFLGKKGLFDVPDYSMSDEKIGQSLDKAYKTPVMGVELALAESCNLACKYCYCGTCRNMPNDGLMSEKVAHQTVLWLFDAAEKNKKPTVNITFFGGEPLLNKPVIYSIVAYSQLLAKMRKKKVSYHMTTNGTLLDDKFLNYAKKYNIGIMVSLDGPREIHDRQCPMQNGKGSFEAATKGARRLLGKFPQVQMTT